MESGNKAVAVGEAGRVGGLWLWFVSGFLPVFVGMLLFVRIMAMHPSGQYVVVYRLWEYYGVEMPRLFLPHTLAPASGGSMGLAETMAQHVLVSVAGGCAALGIGWWLRRRRSGKVTDAPDATDH